MFWNKAALVLLLLLVSGAAEAACPSTYPFQTGCTLPAAGLNAALAAAYDGTAAVLPDAQANLKVTPSVSSGITPNSVAIGAAGTNYAAGDTVTLTCTGCTITTNPVIVIGSVSGGAATNIQLRVSGVITGALSASLTFTQASTSGTGTGLTVTGTLGPFASAVGGAALATGGGVINGNVFLGGAVPLTTLYGGENLFITALAGGHFDTTSTANVAVGWNACGSQGAAAFVGSFNICLGTDAGRNIAGGSNNVIIGEGAGRVVASNSNTIAGMGSGVLIASGGQNTIFGQGSGTQIAGGIGNLILGPLVATTTLAGGSSNILISAGNQADVDTPGVNTSDMLNLKRTIAGTTTNHANNNNPSICAVGMSCVLGVLRSANFNSTADQSIIITALNSNQSGYIAGATKYVITEIWVTNCSASLTTAQGGFYTAATKGGTIIGATTTAYTDCTSTTTREKLSALTNMDTTTLTATPLRLSLTTAQGGAATADVYVLGYPIN